MNDPRIPVRRPVRSGWARLLIVVAFAGGVTSWVLALRTAVVLG